MCTSKKRGFICKEKNLKSKKTKDSYLYLILKSLQASMQSLKLPGFNSISPRSTPFQNFESILRVIFISLWFVKVQHDLFLSPLLFFPAESACSIPDQANARQPLHTEYLATNYLVRPLMKGSNGYYMALNRRRPIPQFKCVRSLASSFCSTERERQIDRMTTSDR